MTLTSPTKTLLLTTGIIFNLMLIPNSAFAFVEEDLQPNEYPSIICAEQDPRLGQLYFAGDANNSLQNSGDMARYLNDRENPNHIGHITEYVDIADAVFILTSLFRGTGPLDIPESGDANGDGVMDLSDALSILKYLFGDGSAPGNGELKVVHKEHLGTGIDVVNHMPLGEEHRMTIEHQGEIVNVAGIPFRKILVSYQDDAFLFDYIPIFVTLGPYDNPWSYMYHPKDIVCPDGTLAKGFEFYLPDLPNTVTYIEINGQYTSAPFKVSYQGYEQLAYDFPVYYNPFNAEEGSADADCNGGGNAGLVVHVKKLDCPPAFQTPELSQEDIDDMLKPHLGKMFDDYGSDNPFAPVGPRPSSPSCNIELPDWLQDAVDTGKEFSKAMNDAGINFAGGAGGEFGASVGLNGTGVARGSMYVAEGCTTAYNYCQSFCQWTGDKLSDAARATADAISDAVDSLESELDDLSETIKGWFGG